MWDALVDRTGSTVNQFPDQGELDFRNPNKFHPWMLGKRSARREKLSYSIRVPLGQSQKAEENRSRGVPPQKLYGKSYAELFKEEYGKNKSLAQMPRLVRLAQNTTDDPKAYIYAPETFITLDRGTGITTRDQFFDKKKHRTA